MQRLKAAICSLAVVAGIVIAGPQTQAQPFPSKPVRVVVPYPPGGATDISLRIYAPFVSDTLGQQIIIENKPGAGTNLGGEHVARSAPDGYTLYVASFASHSVNRWLFRKMPYDPAKDLIPVAMLTRGPQFLCLKPNSPFKTVADLIAFGRTNPGKLTFGSAGNGSPNHICGELLKQIGKFEAVHVPYKGSAELQADLVAGQIDYAFDGAVIQHHRSGKLRCIGGAASFRWPTDPDIPPLNEAGAAGFDIAPYFALMAPAGTPPDVVARLHAAFLAAAQKPEVAEKLRVTSGIPFPATLKETQDFIANELVKWEGLIKATGAKID